MKRLKWMLFASLLFVVGCSSFHDGQKMQCGEVSYISEFPMNVELNDASPLPLDLVGCVDVINIDTLMIFKLMDGDYHWKVYSLNSHRFLDYLFARGHGSNEFVRLPCSELGMKTDTALYCDFVRSDKTVWYRCNLTQSLKQKCPVWEQQVCFDKYGDVDWLFSLSDTLFFLVRTNNYAESIRSLYENGVILDLSYLGNLNEIEIEEDINTLSAVRCVNRKRMMIAEAMLRLNQINLYSLTSDSSKTLCVGNELSDVGEVDRCPKQLKHEYYGNILSYDDYFVALYHNFSVMDYWMGTGTSELQFFDWSGRPLLRLKLPMMVTSFFIYRNRYVYVFSSIGEEELIYKYDCGEVLGSII